MPAIITDNTLQVDDSTDTREKSEVLPARPESQMKTSQSVRHGGDRDKKYEGEVDPRNSEMITEEEAEEEAEEDDVRESQTRTPAVVKIPTPTQHQIQLHNIPIPQIQMQVQTKPHIHARSRSLATPTAPIMARAHSSPGLDSRGRYVFPRSTGKLPAGPHDMREMREIPLRRPSPLRTSFDGPTATSMAVSEPISEQPELQASPISYYVDTGSTSNTRPGGRSVSPSWSPSVNLHNSLPRISRRRPSSPLLTSTSVTSNSNSSFPPSRPSPLVLPARFNEPYPTYSLSSASSISMPSTPSSIRSRSPSISSLETIPDIPDAEAAAIEADQIARLKAAADKADAAADGGFSFDPKRRSAIDVSPMSNSRFGSGWADKRKRWSVCGAEGRQDLDLETIWED